MRQTLSVIFILGCFATAQSQVSVISKRYDYGKTLYSAANYAAAAEVFQTILDKSPNPYEQYSKYFLGMCHYHLNKKAESKAILSQLLESPLPPSLLKDEVRLVLGTLEFESLNYEEGLKIFQRIKDPSVLTTSRNACKKYLSPLDSKRILEINKIAPEKIPDDLLFAKILQLPPDQRPQDILPRLRQKFALPKTPLTQERKKDTIRIAFFLPLGVERISPFIPFHNSQRYIDFLQGVRLAVKELDSAGIPVKIYIFDSEKDSSRIVNFFTSPELRGMDLFVGPVTPTNFILAQEFASHYQIPIVYPLWSVEGINLEHPYTYSLASSLKTQSVVSAGFASSYLESKIAHIIYDDTKSDSLAAKAHADAFEKNGGQVRTFFKMTREKNLFPKLLAELKIAESEKINHHFFSAVRDEVNAMTLVSAFSNLSGKRPLLIPENWLDFNQIHYTQLENLNAYVLAPTFVSHQDSIHIKFISDFTQLCNITPFEPSYMGYEIMIYFTKNLHAYGKNTLAKLHKNDPKRWGIFHGIDLRRSKDNRYFPIVKFVNGDLEIVNSFEP